SGARAPRGARDAGAASRPGLEDLAGTLRGLGGAEPFISRRSGGSGARRGGGGSPRPRACARQAGAAVNRVSEDEPGRDGVWVQVATRGALEPAEREWLHTNGAGAYAMSTLALMHTRRFHGLLVA